MVWRIQSTPSQDGFRMPGEFEPHDGCWMLWPQRTDSWRLGAKPAQKAFVEVASAISQFEPVTMGVSHEQFSNARQMLPEDVRVVEISNNDSWMRDIGPTFVINGKGDLRLVDWIFNAWGGLDEGLYFPWDLDEMVPQKVAELVGVDRYKAPLVLEGGSIHVDGEGTLITTEQCLLNPNRNLRLSRADIENLLCQYTGVEKIIWLPRGSLGDETDGHVDGLCCFVRPGVVVLSWKEDPSNPRCDLVKEAFEILSTEVDARGRRLEVHTINDPAPVVITEEEAQGIDIVEGSLPRRAGDRLGGTYINFYIANGGIVAPLFNDPADKPALEKMQELFPDRRVVGVYSREIRLCGGNIHCITQQQPRP